MGISVGASSHLTSILCWTFLPSFLSNLLLGTYYRFSPASRPVLPANPSPQQIAHENGRARNHARNARLILIGGYLFYTIAITYIDQGRGANANYYTLLGIEREVVEEEGAAAVKSRWRRLARVYHPDKIGKEGEAFFVELKKGVDVLENEGKRWAYERFGADISTWGKLVTNREFLVRGVQQSAAFYIFALGSIIAVSYFRKDERAHNFWRYLALFFTLSTELHLLLLPSLSPLFSFLLPNRLTFEHIAFLRQLFVSCSMAISQVAPLLFPEQASAHDVDPNASPEEQAAARALADADALKPLLQRLALLTAQADAECRALQQQEMRPLFVASAVAGEDNQAREKREKAIVEDLKNKMAKTFEDLQLKSAPQTAEIWANAVKRGRSKSEASKSNGVKSSASSGTSTPSRLPTVAPVIRSPSPSPSFTAASAQLASPPSSPKLASATAPPEAVPPLFSTPSKHKPSLLPKDVPLPPSPASPGTPAVSIGLKHELKEPSSPSPDARRLQSPPPE